MNLFTEIKWCKLTLGGFLDDDHIRENSFTYRFLTDRLKVPKHAQGKRNAVDDGCSQDESEDKPPDTVQPTDEDGTRRRTGCVDLDAPANESGCTWQNKRYIPGIVSRLPFPKQSSITKQEQATFIELHSKLVNKRSAAGATVSALDQKQFATYIELNNKVMAERAEYLSFLKDHWKIQSIKFNRLASDIERYTTESWEHRVRARLPSYARYYTRVKSIPLVYQGEKSDVRLIPGETLLQLGTYPMVIHPNFKFKVQIPQDTVAVSKRYPPDCEQVDFDTTNTIHKLPVSADANARQLSLAYDANIVITSAGLKAIANNHSDYGRTWDAPVVVREYRPRDPKDPSRRLVFVDKPLPRRGQTVAETNERYHKLGCKTLWCHPRHNKALRFQFEPNSGARSEPTVEPVAYAPSVAGVKENATDSDSTGDESCDDLRIDESGVSDCSATSGRRSRSRATPGKRRKKADSTAPDDSLKDDEVATKPETSDAAMDVKEEEKERPKGVFVKPGPHTNVTYRMWTMKKEAGSKEELPRHMLKQPTGIPDRELRILVRNKLDGFIGAGHHKQVKSPVAVLPKLEYQSEYGAEKMTRTELINEWLALKFRPGARLTRVRVNAETSEVLLMENLSLDELTQQAKRSQGSSFVDDVTSTLYGALSGLVDLPPGRYLLTHSPSMQAFATLQTGNDDFGIFDLQQVYSSPDPDEPTKEEMAWIEVDTGFTMPYHAVFSRVPGTFYPGYTARPVVAAKPVKKVVVKTKKKKKKAGAKKKKADDKGK